MRNRHGRYARYVAPLAPTVGRPQMDVRDAPRESARRARRDSASGRAHGRGKSDVGLHADSRRAEERGDRAVGRRSRMLKAAGVPPVPERPTSWQTFLRDTLGRDCRRRFLHDVYERAPQVKTHVERAVRARLLKPSGCAPRTRLDAPRGRLSSHAPSA